MKLLHVKILALFASLTSLASAQTITFEPDAQGLLPDGSQPVDNLAITDQFLRFGVRFGLDNDLDGQADPDAHPFLEERGEDGSDGFDNNSGGRTVPDVADSGYEAQLGQFFLRTRAVSSTTDVDTLLVSYTTPVAVASGEIWDIDTGPQGTEKWDVEALDAHGVVLEHPDQQQADGDLPVRAHL